MDGLILPVKFKGKELEPPIRMFNYGWTYRIEVTIEQQQVLFEPDEEGALRALGPVAIDAELIMAIAAELEKLR